MSEALGDESLSCDGLLGGRLRLLQPRSGHRAGTDAVLLAASVRAEPGAVIADVGAGTGAVALMAALASPGARLLLVERDPELAAIAGRNLALNGREGEVVVADVLGTGPEHRGGGLTPGTADLVVTNPPFLDAATGRPSPERRRFEAHTLPTGALPDWLTACALLLHAKGRLAMIHRADAVAACLSAWPKGFGAFALRFVHPREGEAASRVLIQARRGSRAPLQVLAPLMLHEVGGGFTPLARALHDGHERLA